MHQMTNGLPAHGSVIERAIVLGDGIVHGLVTMTMTNMADGPQVIHATMVRIGGPGANGERRWKVVQTPLLDFVHPCTFPLLEPDDNEDDGLKCGNVSAEQLSQQIADFWKPCECFPYGNDERLIERAEAALGRTFPLKGKPDQEFMSLLGTPSLCCREKISGQKEEEGKAKWIKWPTPSDRVIQMVRTIGIGLAGAGAGVAISAFGGPISLGTLGAAAAAYWYTSTTVVMPRNDIEML